MGSILLQECDRLFYRYSCIGLTGWKRNRQTWRQSLDMRNFLPQFRAQ
jgi:hypothetical protein